MCVGHVGVAHRPSIPFYSGKAYPRPAWPHPISDRKVLKTKPFGAARISYEHTWDGLSFNNNNNNNNNDGDDDNDDDDDDDVDDTDDDDDDGDDDNDDDDNHDNDFKTYKTCRIFYLNGVNAFPINAPHNACSKNHKYGP